MDKHERNKLVIGTLLLGLVVVGFLWWSDATVAKAGKDRLFRIDLYHDNYNTPMPSLCNNISEIPQSECNALVALYHSTDGANWTNHTGWLVTLTPCSWFGVTCTNNRVTRLVLGTNQLSGSIPAQLGNLTNLQELDLYFNGLSGSIPPELGNLVNLQVLSLGFNGLSGSIPPQLGNLTNLQRLGLDTNQLSGNIPAQLGNLANLQVLVLHRNQLSGSIPAELGRLTNLQSLYLFSNQLSGSVPAELGNLINLEDFLLNSNGLSGPLPGNFINLTNLSRFWFSITNLCEPADAAFQAWLAGISDLERTDVKCATQPTPTFTPTPIPTPSSGCQFVGNIKVCADAFTNTGNGWTTNGAVRIGDYTTVDNGRVTANNGALSGNGLVSMRTRADGSQTTALFRDSFDITTDSGILTPKAISGYEFKLTNLVGFNVQQNLYQLTVDVRNGQVRGNLNLAVVIPGQNVVKTINFTLDHNGAVSGALTDVRFDLGRITLNVQQAALSNAGFTLQSASLQLPSTLGGANATLTVNDARITGDGRLTLGSGSATINFPNINVGGANGFSITGAQTTLTIANDLYLFSGRGTFVLPGIGPGDSSCKIGTSFTFASRPPPVREAALSLDGCFKIPIASTGFFLTGVSGAVQLDESSVAIDLGIGVEGGPDIPGLGVAISGQPSVHWDNSWAVGLQGTLKIFKFDAADAALKLSKARGLEGQIHISLVGGVIDGSSSLRVWRDNSSFHLTGKALVQVKIEKGKFYHHCTFLGCIDVPPTTVQGPSAGADFGEFRVNNRREYGLKGSGSAFGYQYAFFVDALGNIKFDGLDQYQPVRLQQLGAQNGQPADSQLSDIRQFIVAANTPTLLVELAVQRGAPTLRLVTPGGQSLQSGSPGVITTTSLTQTLLTLANPLPGQWQIHVENLSGGEQYEVVALGARPAAVVSIPAVTDNGDGSYTLSLVATSHTPTSTISLFYDTSPSARTGQLLAQDLPLTTTTYRWQPERIAAGTYYLYALVDDPLGAPAFAYAPSPLILLDSTPPAPPTGLQVNMLGSTAQITWQPSSTPDVAGYHIYYREPGGATFVVDIPNSQQISYIQSGLYLNGGWEIAVSAYDLSGNESARSAEVVAPVYLRNVYLPVVTASR